jgi:prevent-host-death family protein
MTKTHSARVEIGAYEAKTRLPELLRKVKEGQRFTITNRGEAIADLVPSEHAKRGDPTAAVERFRAFIRDNPVRARANIKSLIDEGRE